MTSSQNNTVALKYIPLQEGGSFMKLKKGTKTKFKNYSQQNTVISIICFQSFTYDDSVQHKVSITQKKFIQVDYHEQADISRYFMEVIEFVNKNRINTNVLIHCYAGTSRSATLIIGYSMSQCHMSFDQAFRYVQSKRSIICPNIGFFYQLKRLENSIHMNQFYSPRDQHVQSKISSPSQHQRERVFGLQKRHKISQ